MPIRTQRLAFLLIALLLSTSSFAAKLPSADKIFAEAKVQAGAQQKNILLVFESSWCGPCEEFHKFLAEPGIHNIIGQHFILATLAIAEEDSSKDNPGGLDLLARLGGVHAGEVGVPIIFVLDAKGKVIVTSERPVPGKRTGENIGYPTEPEEIAWFLTMMKKGAPSLSDDEARTMEDWLRNAAS